MYRNVSRSVSPSSPSRRVAKVDLDCIEEMQDAWCRRNEALRDPPPPPLLNSPRSLRACAVADVSPQTSLLKLSLKQHLFRVLGNPHTLTTLPNPTTAEYKELLQVALRAFREAALGLGTSQEKLAAFIAFKNQEELRVPLLATLRDLRRQLTADDLAIADVASAHHRHKSTASSPQSRVNAAKATPLSPSSASAEEEEGEEEEANALRRHRGQGSRRNSADAEVSITLPMNRGTAAAVRATPSAAAAAAPSPVSNDETDDFTPPVTRYGGLPYKPRDVSLLNSSYFANRSIPSNASNPSGAPLPTSAPATPSRALLRTASRAASKQPSQLTASPPSLHMPVDTSLDTTLPDADGEVSLLGGPAKDPLAQRSIQKQDLSVVSIDSSHLERLLSMSEPTASAAEVLAARRLASEHADSAGTHTTPAAHRVTLFHAGTATAAAAHEAGPTAAGQPLTPRGRRAYTNHTRRASLLVPNSATAPSTAAPPAPSREEAQPSTVPAPERRVSEDGGRAGARQSTPPSPQQQQQQLPPPPAITLAEQRDGFVYFCANPSNTAARFYSGAHVPLSVAVQL